MSLRIETYVMLLAHLHEAPVSAQDLTALTGLHIYTTREFLKQMHKRKLIHIAQWDTRYNKRIKLPMFKLGEGTDVPKPKRLPGSLLTKRWRERKKIKESYNPFYNICRPVGMAVSDKTDSTKRPRAA